MAQDGNANPLQDDTIELSVMVKLVSSFAEFFLETSKKPLNRFLEIKCQQKATISCDNDKAILIAEIPVQGVYKNE